MLSSESFSLSCFVPRSSACYGRHNINVKHRRTIFSTKAKTNLSLDDPETVKGGKVQGKFVKIDKIPSETKNFFIFMFSASRFLSSLCRIKGYRGQLLSFALKILSFIIKALDSIDVCFACTYELLRARVPS